MTTITSTLAPSTRTALRQKAIGFLRASEYKSLNDYARELGGTLPLLPDEKEIGLNAGNRAAAARYIRNLRPNRNPEAERARKAKYNRPRTVQYA